MGIFDYIPKIVPDIGPISGAMPQIPQQGGGFFSGIGDWLGGEFLFDLRNLSLRRWRHNFTFAGD